jgi:hypothetical protein
LHVLGTPPAFILSQDQTLHKRSLYLAQKNQQAMLHSLVFKEHSLSIHNVILLSRRQNSSYHKKPVLSTSFFFFYQLS